jgi:hypothetical protein
MGASKMLPNASEIVSSTGASPGCKSDNTLAPGAASRPHAMYLSLFLDVLLALSTLLTTLASALSSCCMLAMLVCCVTLDDV